MPALVAAICLLNCREPAGTIADQSGESAQAAVANETALDDGAKSAWIDITAGRIIEERHVYRPEIRQSSREKGREVGWGGSSFDRGFLELNRA